MFLKRSVLPTQKTSLLCDYQNWASESKEKRENSFGKVIVVELLSWLQTFYIKTYSIQTWIDRQRKQRWWTGRLLEAYEWTDLVCAVLKDRTVVIGVENNDGDVQLAGARWLTSVERSHSQSVFWLGLTVERRRRSQHNSHLFIHAQTHTHYILSHFLTLVALSLRSLHLLLSLFPTLSYQQH